MSTQKEIFQENMNALFEAVNEKVGTNGAMTIAEMKTAVENAVVPYKAKILWGYNRITTPYNSSSTTKIYKHTLTETLEGYSGYVLFKLTFSNNVWQVMKELNQNSNTDIGTIGLYVPTTENLSTYVTVVKQDNILYFLASESTIYITDHSFLVLNAPILCKNTPAITAGSTSSNALYKTTLCARSERTTTTIVTFLNNLDYNYSIASITIKGSTNGISISISGYYDSENIVKYL